MVYSKCSSKDYFQNQLLWDIIHEIGLEIQSPSGGDGDRDIAVSK